MQGILSDLTKNGLVVTAMILLKDTNPIFTVRVLRFSICAAALLGVAYAGILVLGEALKIF